MNNNKGYSLTELLLAIFVLSIVMLGIAGILRSTSQFYRNGVQEVRVQEEAQLAVNLIEEKLVDATGSTTAKRPVWDASAERLTFYDEDDRKINITYQHTSGNPQGQLLMGYWENPDNTGNYIVETLADYVTGFEVAGIDYDTSHADADNKVVVSVSMNNNGYEYTASKEVYMRNNLENPSMSINTSAINNTSSTSLWNYEVELARFDSYNITNWCYADPTKPIYAVHAVTTTDSDGNTVESLQAGGSFASYFAIDADKVTVRINAARTNDFSASSPGDCGLMFTDKRDGLQKAVRFSFVPVKVDVSPNADIFVHYASGLDINGQGYQTYVEVEGIDINKAIANGTTGTAKITLNDGSSSISKDFTLSSGQTTVNNGQQFQNQINIGIVPDVQSHGLFIGATNGAQVDSYSGGQSGTLKVEITLTPSSGSAYTNTLNYKFRIAGNVL